MPTDKQHYNDRLLLTAVTSPTGGLTSVVLRIILVRHGVGLGTRLDRPASVNAGRRRQLGQSGTSTSRRLVHPIAVVHRRLDFVLIVQTELRNDVGERDTARRELGGRRLVV